MEEALRTLASRAPTIEAIGVTDYFSTVSFRHAQSVLEDGVAPTIRYAFPNVELRLDNATSSNLGVNCHLICRPEDVDLLDEFLGRLEFSWAEKTYRADTSGLVRLGREHSGDGSLDEDAAFKAGTLAFKVNFEDLRRQLRTDRWARENLLVAVAGGEVDGTSGLRKEDGSFAARRQSIEALADIVFSGNPQQAKFWSGNGAASKETIEEVYGGPKLCLHGSDAHKRDQLGQPAKDRYCWLKGDPSFDTLKLACLSPSTRSHIGDKPPVEVKHGRIIRLHVSSPDWFVNEQVPLNPGLVAIIGARGSGKTALADLIAAGAGSAEPFSNNSSFVSRAGKLLEGSVAVTDWSHDAVTTCSFGPDYTPDRYDRPVRYLSQQFVERLCASDGVSDDLLAEIERVIFEAWPVGRRQGADGFRELLEIRLSSARERQDAALSAVLDLSRQITDVRLRKGKLSGWRDELAKREADLQSLKQKIADLTGSADRSSAERLTIVSRALRERQEEVQRLDRQRTSLKALKSAVDTARSTNFPRELKRLQREYEKAGLNESQWEAFRTTFVGDVDSILEDELSELEQRIKAVEGSSEEPEEVRLDDVDPPELLSLTVSTLLADAARLQNLVGLDKTRSKQLNAMTTSFGEDEARIVRIKSEIQKVEAESDVELFTERLARYEEYFKALIEEEEELRKLYSPLEKVLQGFGESVAKLRFRVKRDVDVQAWATEGESLLDLRRDGKFRGEGELAQVAAAELLPVWQSGDAKEAARAIGEFTSNYSRDIRDQRPPRIKSEEDRATWEASISRWLYRTNHIRLRYDLEYDGLSVERLSPGTRGIVLLLLYLAVDQEEDDPLIIDQPEENLDPESVYSELVELFRAASERRQIIMVTHNANLVINTDVDQVIVARCGALGDGHLPELTYESGGLENPAIRRSVCEVLEGGAEAFKQRARRLGLDLTVEKHKDD